jgi:outer membrane cobalamin receptor
MRNGLSSRLPVIVVLTILGIAPPLFPRRQEGKENQAEKKGQKIIITEEIQVVGKAPREQPIASVTRLDFTLIEKVKPRDLSEVIRYAPGVMVTYGNKYEFTLKLRGMDSRRIALLIDGVPSYEPYYGSFDLKTVSAAGLDSLQITKGPSSVLYGPNTLAGIVNVVTRRPGPEPGLTVNGGYGERNTISTGLDGSVQWKKFSLAGTASYQKSDGFAYPDPATGDKTAWQNTDYRRFNLNAKLFYAPSGRTEIMVNGGIYTSAYGMPPAVGFQKARYWHFKNWDRYALNAGGFTALGDEATLRFRAFLVNYRNTLDQYRDQDMTNRQFESTFNNSVYGAFVLADLGLSSSNALKASLNFQKDVSRQQDDVGLPWVTYDQGTFSAAVEDHVSLNERWKLIAGASLDVIDKFTGGTATRLNPLAGLKFTPADYLDLHLSVAQKSRFPNMRAMYSPSGGNPDLLSETGTTTELGFAWSKGLSVAGSVFLTKFENMIDTMVLADGTRRNFNVGKAHLNGLELQVQKMFGAAGLTLNYTFLDQGNDVDNRPLDVLPQHSLNFDFTLRPVPSLRFSLYGQAASKSYWWDTNAKPNREENIPAYFNADAVASYDFGRLEIFVKVTNIANDFIYSEPIFPWRARFFEVGANVRVF